MPERTGKRATAEIVENVPVEQPSRSPEVFIAQHEGRVEVSREETGQGEEAVKTVHTRPGTLIMYKPTESQGYVPRTVSVSAVRMLLTQGWHEFCPDCKKRHIDRDGNESTDPNLCSARDPVAVRVCRVCQKRIYDNQGFRFDGPMGATDPNVIEDDAYTATTPEERTQASLNLHYWIRHPRQAQMMNLPPLPEQLRDMVGEVK
jgi:hypothetical protein